MSTTTISQTVSQSALAECRACMPRLRAGAPGSGVSPELYRLCAALLEYPTPALARQAGECCELLPAISADAAEEMASFRRFVDETAPARVEEIYTAAFDLQAACCPYVGYQLFGESYKRGIFMAQLNEGYGLRGFSAGSELPDHVAVVLRFLASGREDDFYSALRRDGLIPALAKMEQSFGKQSGNPYAQVIRALLLVLGCRAEAEKEADSD